MSLVLNGHLECLKYARENGCRWRQDTFNAARGHLVFAIFARERMSWDEDTCSKAAKNGHLAAHVNGCRWNKVLSDCRRQCLKYARENGCRWDKETCRNAALNGHLECLQYAHETNVLRRIVLKLPKMVTSSVLNTRTKTDVVGMRVCAPPFETCFFAITWSV